MSWAIEHKRYSQRRACGSVSIDPRVYRYKCRRPDDAGLRQRLRELASERRRFGYRRLHILLKREGIEILEEALSSLSRGTAHRAQAWWPQEGLGHTGADGDPSGSEPALVTRLRIRHAG